MGNFGLNLNEDTSEKMKGSNANTEPLDSKDLKILDIIHSLEKPRLRLGISKLFMISRILRSFPPMGLVLYHYQELRTSRYSITSCLNCDFRHSNASVVKLHCEITHPCCIGIKYISHHRFMSKSKSIQQFHIKNNEHLNLPELYERLRMVFRK